jgi:hypothetical protein
MSAKLMLLICSATALLGSGCDQDQRIASLEKQVKVLNDKLDRQTEREQAIAEYDLEARCSRDSRQWFIENWSRDKDTIILTYTNHYNKRLNNCFVYVQWHYTTDKRGSWMNDMELWNVHENTRLATCGERTFVLPSKNLQTEQTVFECDVQGRKCKTLDEFNNLINPLLTN